MSVHKLTLITSTVVTAVLLLVGSAAAQDPPDSAEDSAFVPGEILVKFLPHVRSYGAQASLAAEGVYPVEMSLYSDVMRVKVVPGQEAETIASLLARGDVEYATLNHIVQAQGEPNDPGFPLQWALNNTGQTGGTSDADIDAAEAWDIFTGTDNITIAIIDSGVDTNHEDLVDNIWRNSDEIPANGLDDDHNGFVDDVVGYDFANNDSDPFDDFGHGTHVAGIAAARGNNGKGGAGVSWAAKIMPLKVLNESGSGSISGLETAIYYAVANGANVINMSLGDPSTQWPCGWQSIEDALEFAVNNDVLVVVAAGNSSRQGVICPAAYDQVMAVGSTTMHDQRSFFSNYGPRLDIAAPGGQGFASCNGEADYSDIYSTLPSTGQGNYGCKAGTSMSTPHVAGLAALLWSIDPAVSATQIRDLIQNSADDLVPPGGGESCSTAYPGYVGGSGWDPCFGNGRINARQALLSFGSIGLQEASGLPLPAPIVFLADDDRGPLPPEKIVQVAATGPDIITWTATISPSVSWLSISSAASGLVTSSVPDQFTVAASTPADHGVYTTTLVVSGINSLGGEVGPATAEVRLDFLAELQEYRLPVIYKK